MKKSDIALATTNTTPKSCVNADCDCDTMWSLTQQFSTVRLCAQTGERKGKLIKNYSVRARRIAATYARLYLEAEDGGSPEFRGRYYWMAIGAFASKTVACTFDAWQVKTLEALSKTVKDGLGKGNFWLFCDISGWHWYHNMFRKSFDQCLSERNSDRYVREVKDQLRQLPWNSEALPRINNLKVSPHIISGFKKVKQFEKTATAKRPDFQFGNLIDLAKHEQGVILQPLIYNDPAFAGKIDLQRSWWVSWASPTVELVFNHACTIKDREFKSIAPDKIVLEDFDSRMAWITTAAQQFHNLMQRKKSYMENELQIMADWVDRPDQAEVISTVEEAAGSAGDAIEEIKRSAGEALDGIKRSAEDAVGDLRRKISE